MTCRGPGPDYSRLHHLNSEKTQVLDTVPFSLSEIGSHWIVQAGLRLVAVILRRPPACSCYSVYHRAQQCLLFLSHIALKGGGRREGEVPALYERQLCAFHSRTMCGTFQGAGSLLFWLLTLYGNNR